MARVLRGLVAAAFTSALLIALGGGPSKYFARWERTSALVIAAIGGFGFFALLNLGRDLRTEVLSQRYFPALIFLAEGPALLAPWLDVHPDMWPALHVDGTAVRVAGLCLAASGSGLQIWSELTLGRHYTGRVGILEGHELVRDGPFRVIRHPAYAGRCWPMLGADSRSGCGSASRSRLPLRFCR